MIVAPSERWKCRKTPWRSNNRTIP